MHIVIIADPIDKQKAGIHYLTKHLVSQLLAIKTQNTFTIIRLNKDPNENDRRIIALKNSLPFIHHDPIRTFITLPLLIRKLNPDIVVETAHFGPFNLSKHIKRINIIHDLSPIKFKSFHPFWSYVFQRILLPLIIKKADLLITNSKNTSNDLKKYFPDSEHKISKIYPGLEDLFKPIKAEYLSSKPEITNAYFLSVGTIEPRKNLNTLLDAFEIFKQSHKTKIQLIIIGDKGWKSRSFYRKLISHPFKNDIKILGYIERSDLTYWYAKAQAFIYPSYYEGFGLPVLEAMACGTPCIVSNKSSLPEVGGDAVLYFDPYKTHELVDKMNLIFHNKAIQNSLGELGIKQASRFSWEKYATEFNQLLDLKFGDHLTHKNGLK